MMQTRKGQNKVTEARQSYLERVGKVTWRGQGDAVLPSSAPGRSVEVTVEGCWEGRRRTVGPTYFGT